MSNEYKEFKESDWKLFRKKIIEWQENYMAKLNKEYIEILSRDKNPSDNFWKLENRIKRDKNKIGVTICMKRSTMVISLIELLNDEVIKIEDLDEFSDVLKDRLQTIININQKYKEVNKR